MPTPECAVCGPIDASRTLLNECRYCGEKHCPEHMLPENHDCIGLLASGATGWGSGEPGPENAQAPAETADTRRGWPSDTRGRAPSLTAAGGGQGAGSAAERASLADRSRTVARGDGGRWLARLGKVGVVLIVLVGIAALAGQYGAVLSGDGAAAGPADPAAPPTSGAVATLTPTPTTTDAPALAPEAVAAAIHEEVNRVRKAHDRPPLRHEGRLQTAARRHSQAMASEGRIFHDGPDGELGERLDRAGYDCRVPMGDGRFATGGENVAMTWYEESITGGEYYDSVDELAAGLVKQWLDSPGHRENLLAGFWRAHGAGVAVVEEDGATAVYATQIFC